MERMTDINKTLKQLKEKLMELGDSKKENRVSLLRTSITLQFTQKMQQAILDGEQYYRVSLTDKISLLRTQKCNGYILQSHNRNESVLFMSNEEFEANEQNSYAGSLLIYLTKQLNEYGLQVTEAAHLWLPMVRIPGQFAERDEVYSRIAPLSEFAMLKKHLYFSEEVEWFCNASLQNGIKIEPQQRDLIVRRPYILAVLSGGMPVYAKHIH